MDLISVIMPTYKNSKKMLKNAIMSVLNQTYTNYELIIINDNTEEKYIEIVRNIISELDTKKIIYHENEKNMGSAKSRNIGISLSKGNYITFLDDDDEYLPKKIELQYHCMHNANADYCISNIKLFSERGKLIDKRNRDYLGTAINNKKDLLCLHFKYHMTGTDTLMYKKDYLEKIGRFPLKDLGDEFYLMFNSINENGKLVYCNYCGVHAVVHEGEIGLSSGKNKIKCEEDLYMFKKRYFSLFSKETIKFIKTRHFAVLAFAELRNRQYFKMFIYMLKAFIISPKNCFLLLKNRKE